MEPGLSLELAFIDAKATDRDEARANLVRWLENATHDDLVALVSTATVTPCLPMIGT